MFCSLLHLFHRFPLQSSGEVATPYFISCLSFTSHWPIANDPFAAQAPSAVCFTSHNNIEFNTMTRFSLSSWPSESLAPTWPRMSLPTHHGDRRDQSPVLSIHPCWREALGDVCMPVNPHPTGVVACLHVCSRGHPVALCLCARRTWADLVAYDVRHTNPGCNLGDD